MRRVLVIVAAGLALAGCGDDSDDPVAGSISSSSTATTVPESTTTTAAATTTTTVPGLSEESPLRFDGIGPIKIGMTPAEATEAVGKPVTVDPDEVLNGGCGYAKVQGGPEDLGLMVLRDKETDPWRIVRVDVWDESRIATVSGIRIGATEAEVKSTYSGPGKTGKLEEEGHAYVEEGHYLTYDVDGPGGLLLLFETDGTKVTRFRAGEQEPVGYVEGCA